TASALTSKLWLVKPDASGEWQAKEVAVIGDPAKIPLPVDISINKDGTGLWVNTFMDGKTRYFDLSNPEQPKQTYERVTGKQVNMISQSWDGTRVYIASSLLANWDKGGAHEPDVPGAVTMDFVPPPAGSYALPAIMRAPDGTVLDPDGRRLPLSRFTAGKITLLGFIYTSCADARGCPLAYQVFHTVRHRV